MVHVFEQRKVNDPFYPPSGILGIIWFLFWAVLAYSSPATHPRISKAEREYIETSIGDKKDEVCICYFSVFYLPLLASSF